MLPESLDLIILSVYNNDRSKAKAYVFNTKFEPAQSNSEVTRLSFNEVIDPVTAENIKVICNIEKLEDFEISPSRDVILRKCSLP